MNPNTCQFCGAKVKSDWMGSVLWFECGTMVNADNPLQRHDQTMVCVQAEVTKLERQRDEALRQRNEWFNALCDQKENLALIIPALETASGIKADDLRATCPDNGISANEWAALWMASAIQERATNH